MTTTKKQQKKDTQLKYYLKFDKIPIYNFIQVTETQDLRFLLVLDDYDELPKIDIDIKLWESIYFEYLDLFGENKQRENYRKKSNEFWYKYWTYVATKNRKLLTKIEQLKRQLINLKEVEENKTQGNFDEQLAILDNHFVGVSFDQYKMSAKRYFTQLKIYQKQIEMQSKK